MAERYVRAVIFDLGNTLWFQALNPDLDRVFRLEAHAVRPLLARWDITIPEPLEKIIEEIWQGYEDAWAAEAQRGTTLEPSLPAFIRDSMSARGIGIDERQTIEWWRAAWIPVRHFGTQLYPDTLDVLRELHERGVRIAVNSNRPCTSDMLWPDLEDFGMAPYVDVAVCSGDTGQVKPHPSTFEMALGQLGVEPAVTAMVGDSCERDCAGAKALDMRTVLKLNGRYDPPPCRDADYMIHDLGELLTLPIFDPSPGAVLSAESLTPHEDGNEDRY